jgi:hypothetical protein
VAGEKPLLRCRVFNTIQRSADPLIPLNYDTALRRAEGVCLDGWGVMQTSDRLFTVLLVLSGIGSTVLIAVAVLF